MRVEIKPSGARGVVTAPPSKSMAHRLLICAGLANGESVIRKLAFSEDVKATIACLRSLGAEIRLDGDTAFVKGIDVKKPLGKTAILPCNECGSTLRFFIPICMLSGEERILTGSPRLLARPLDFYRDVARLENLRFERSENGVIVQGPLYSAELECPGNVSSQYFSGMMFAFSLLDKTGVLKISEPVESRPYIDMTIAALKMFGAEIKTEADAHERAFVITIPGVGGYTPANAEVEGDYSNAAFFEALNFAGSRVSVLGLKPDSIQGDRVYRELFGRIKDKASDEIDISDCPDLGPILFVAAALCGGGRFTGTRRLKIKESDRAQAMKQELGKVGVSVDVEENSVIVHPGVLSAPSEPIDGHNDHRIVMAMAVLLTVTGGVIEGAQAVNKSFPDFFEKLKELGVDLTYGMDQ